ncbi:MAG: hypothetical protein IPJ75_10670 [Ignavibacteriales bacterium]|nr:hypothetical protein [Ignavibacteriales bacterium]
MKPGCFLKTLIVGTILLAAAIYIVTNKGKEWFVDPIKENLLSSAFDSLPNELKGLKDTKEKLMLVERIDSLVAQFKSDSTEATINFSKVENFFETLQDYSKDSLLTSREYEFLKKLTDEMISAKPKNFIEFEKDKQAP